MKYAMMALAVISASAAYAEDAIKPTEKRVEFQTQPEGGAPTVATKKPPDPKQKIVLELGKLNALVASATAVARGQCAASGIVEEIQAQIDEAQKTEEKAQ